MRFREALVQIAVWVDPMGHTALVLMDPLLVVLVVRLLFHIR